GLTRSPFGSRHRSRAAHSLAFFIAGHCRPYGALVFGGAFANRPRSNIVTVIALATTRCAIALRFSANRLPTYCQLRPPDSEPPCFNFFTLPAASRLAGSKPLSMTGGRGRIRTSVARKERQIYSLLVLATHPPVLEKFAPLLRSPCSNSCQLLGPKSFSLGLISRSGKTQNGLVSKDTSPSIFFLRIRSASFPA